MLASRLSLTCELGGALIASQGPLSFTALRLRSVHLTFVWLINICFAPFPALLLLSIG